MIRFRGVGGRSVQVSSVWMSIVPGRMLLGMLSLRSNDAYIFAYAHLNNRSIWQFEIILTTLKISGDGKFSLQIFTTTEKSKHEAVFDYERGCNKQKKEN